MTKAGPGQTVWVEAAYRRFKDVGLSGVKVEAIARDIGTTKGSFYWHFANRQALVDAVMQRWEREATESLIDFAESADGGPHARVRALYDAVAGRVRASRGEVSLYREAEAEGAIAAVHRVTERRISYLSGLLQEAGISPQVAHSRALRAVATVIGIQQLSHGGFESGVSDQDLVTSALADVLAPEH